MEMTRREFVKGGLAALGFLALPGWLFAAPAGWKPKKKANLVVEKGTHATKATKGTKNGDSVASVYSVASVPSLKIKIRPADGNPDSRVYAYDVVVMADDDSKNRYFKSVFFAGVGFGEGHEDNDGITLVDVPVQDLPKGKKLTVAVRPVSSLGTKGKAIATKWRV